MKAITLHQPFASLIALGVKTIETRSRPTKHRGLIAIHAAKTRRWMLDRPGNPRLIGDYIVDSDRAICRKTNLNGLDDPERCPLAFGGVVATANLVDCLLMVVTGDEGAIRTLDIDGDDSLWIVEPQTDNDVAQQGDLEQHEVTDQLMYGDFTPGRWAWLLDDIVPLDKPIPATGRQGLWNWEKPTPKEES